MKLVEFQQSPWQSSHPKYKASVLSITPAPEYANSEVLLSSLYRTIGFVDAQESSVPQAGRELDKKLQKLREKRSSSPEGATVGADTWNTVLHGVLESPKLSNQSAKRLIQVTPLVPGAGPFSGAVRLTGNPWTPGRLIQRMIWLGSEDQKSAQSLWSDLFQSLSVDENDDIFARWLEQEISAWNGKSNWKLTAVADSDASQLSSDDFCGMKFLPARRFTKDIRAIISAKDSMTRRQWTSLLEAVLRLATVVHVAWLCDVQARIWRCLVNSMDGKGPIGESASRSAVFPEDPQYMAYGGKALNGIKDRTSAYLSARLGTNALLWALDEIGRPFEGDISSSLGVNNLCQLVRDNRKALESIGIREALIDIREKEARALVCKKGIGANLFEFSRYVLGQRQTVSHLLRGYDQGFILRKNGSSNSSPWVVGLGPVAILALVHCALAGMGGPRSIHRFCQHLAAYGIVVDRHDIASNDLGHQLRMLGLVLDSPDAESGMLLLPPFPATQLMRREK